MKKKLLMIFILVLTLISLVGCDNGKKPDNPDIPDQGGTQEEQGEDKKPTPEEVVLSAPTNVKYENGTITWDNVEKATGYKVQINNETFEVSETSYKVLEIKDFIDVVTITAKNDQATVLTATPSEPIILKKQLSSDEIKFKIADYDEQGLKPIEKELAQETALLLYKYNLTLDAVSNTNESTLEQLALENKLGDYMSYLISFVDVLFREATPKSEIDATIIPEDEQLFQDLFVKFKEKGLYSSIKEKALDDDKFMNFILPVICRGMSKEIVSDYDLMGYLMTPGEYSLEIVKTPNGFKVYNQISTKTYEISREELEKLRSDDEFNIANYSTVLLELLEKSYTYYKMNMAIQEQEYLEKQLLLNETYLTYYLNQDKTRLNKILTNIYNLGDNIMALQTSFEEANALLQNADTPDKKIVALNEFRKVVEKGLVLIDSIPNEKDLELLLNILVNSDSFDYLITMFTGQVTMLDPIMRKTVMKTGEALIQAFDQVKLILKQAITKNLDLIFIYLNHPEIKQNEDNLINALKDVLKQLQEIKVENLFSVSDVLNILSLVLEKTGTDIKSIVGIVTGIEFDSKLDLGIKELIDSLTDYIKKYDFTKLEAILNNIDITNLEELAPLTNEDKLEIINLIDYLSGYATKLNISSYEQIIKNVIEFYIEVEMVEPTPTKIEEVYNIIEEHRQDFVDIIVLTPKLELFPLNTDNLNNQENLDNLRMRLEIIKNTLTTDKSTHILTALKEIYNKLEIEPDDMIEFLEGDVSAKLARLESLVGKDYSDLTEDEITFIRNVPFEWYFPKLVEYSFDLETNEIVLKLCNPKNGDKNPKIKNQISFNFYCNAVNFNYNKYNAGKAKDELLRIPLNEVVELLKTNLEVNSYEEFIYKCPNKEFYLSGFYYTIEIDGVDQDCYVQEFDLTNYLEKMFNIQ